MDNRKKLSNNHIEICVTKIQRWYINMKLAKQLKSIFKIYISFIPKFCKKTCEGRITEYEKSFGFTEETRVGSKNFNISFGHFMEKVYDVSCIYNKLPSGLDGESKYSLYEAKNRHDTMKQSMAYDEIKPKLEKALACNKKFILLVLNDNKGLSRNIPLHKGCGLSKIEKVKGYSHEKHRWISGDCVYEHLFGTNSTSVKSFILELLRNCRNNE